MSATEALRLRQEMKLSNSAIATKLGYTTQTIRTWIGPTPSELRRPRPDTLALEGNRKRAQSYRDGGMRDGGIANRMGVSRATVQNWLGPSGRNLRAGSIEWENRRNEALRLRNEERLRNVEIAERMGMHTYTVWGLIGAMPISYRPKPTTAHPESMHEEAKRLREEGLCNSHIAARMGIEAGTVDRWIGRTPDHLRRNRDYSSTDYSRRALYLRDCGHTTTEISKIMGVPRSTVGDWIKGIGAYGVPL